MLAPKVNYSQLYLVLCEYRGEIHITVASCNTWINNNRKTHLLYKRGFSTTLSLYGGIFSIMKINNNNNEAAPWFWTLKMTILCTWCCTYLINNTRNEAVERSVYISRGVYGKIIIIEKKQYKPNKRLIDWSAFLHSSQYMSSTHK